MPTKVKKTSSSKKAAKKAVKTTKAAKPVKAAKPAKVAKAVKSAKAAKPAKKAKVAAPKAKVAAKAKPKAAAKSKAAEAAADPNSPKRKLGLRGAAPWAARHAAKHAAEARARAAEPAPPGSARATLRVPSGAEEIKAKIGELYNQTQKIRTLRKRLDKSFHEIGRALADIQQQELYQAKGFGSFETFIEREIDLGKVMCLRLIKISNLFHPEAVLEIGLEKALSALAAIEGEAPAVPTAAPSAPGSFPGSRPTLPLKPPSLRMIG